MCACPTPQVYELQLAELTATRRVAYTNHSAVAKVWHVCTDRPDLIAFKQQVRLVYSPVAILLTVQSQVLTLEPQEQAYIQFRVTCPSAGLHQALVFVNTTLGHTDEAFQLNVSISVERHL